MHLPHVYLYTTFDIKSKRSGSLKRNWFDNLLWLSKTIWTLQQFKMFLNDFLSLVLNSKEISPKKGSGKISKCFSTVNFNGDSVKTLSITFLKQEPINPDE